jgi:hypothetical protein
MGFAAGKRYSASNRAWRSRLFELARVLVRFDHITCFIENANNGIM